MTTVTTIHQPVLSLIAGIQSDAVMSPDRLLPGFGTTVL